MNLHIVPDSKFTDTFCNNLKELDLLTDNALIVRTNNSALKYIKGDLPFAPLYSMKFSSYVRNTFEYDKVFIHQFSPLMYRWVATHKFKSLNWMTWGSDLYNLPFINFNFYEEATSKLFVNKNRDWNNFLYILKVYLTNMPFKNRAYANVKNILTWMTSEYDFAIKNIPALKARHEFFFYENQVPYHYLDQFTENRIPKKNTIPRLIVGNSSTPTNNHIDAVRSIAATGVIADLIIPASYGDKSYTEFLKKNLSFYKNGRIEFIEKFMDFDEYLEVLFDADGLVMNHIRPQGYGNIFMMMYLGKPVFLNEKNISRIDLERNNLTWYRLSDLKNIGHLGHSQNSEVLLNLLSHKKLLTLYRKLFSV